MAKRGLVLLTGILAACAPGQGGTDLPDFEGVWDDPAPGDYIAFTQPLNEVRTYQVDCNGRHIFTFADAPSKTVMASHPSPVLPLRSYEIMTEDPSAADLASEIKAYFAPVAIDDISFACVVMDDGDSSYSYLRIEAEGVRACYTADELESHLADETLPKSESRRVALRVFPSKVESDLPLLACETDLLPVTVRFGPVSPDMGDD